MYEAQGYSLVTEPPTAAERIANPRLARFDWGDDGYPAAMSDRRTIRASPAS